MTTGGPLVASGAHLVGSVPLASAEAVFRTISAEIGDRVRRIPDGETGPRSDWIVWQLPVFTTPRGCGVQPAVIGIPANTAPCTITGLVTPKMNAFGAIFFHLMS